MKIAIATDKDQVSPHFGHCDGFTVYEVQGGEVKGSSFLVNPGRRPGFLPDYLEEQGVNVVIAGGMGAGAVQLFDEKGIEVITGATGDVRQVLSTYLAGELQSTESVCREHQHAEECGH